MRSDSPLVGEHRRVLVDRRRAEQPLPAPKATPTHPLRPLDVAEELLPDPLRELDGLPTPVRVQCRLFDALVLLAAARKEAHAGKELVWATRDIDALCQRLDRLLDQFAS